MGFTMRKLVPILALFLAACGGGGGGGSSTLTADSNAINPCKLKTYNTSYPNEYLGTNPIPTPTQKFDSGVSRGIGLKDYYPGGENNGCSSNIEYSRVVFEKTLDRLVSTGVDVVEIYQYGPINDYNTSVWTMDESRWQIPKSEVAWFVQKAHSKNLKVSLAWQLWPVDANNNKITNYDYYKMPESEMVRILRGWHNVVMDVAKLAKESKVDILNVQWSAFYFPTVTLYPETATQEFLSIIDDIKGVYSGKLYMAAPRFFDKRIIEKVDAIIVPLNPSNWSYIDDINISVSLLKQRYMDSINGIYLDFSLYSNMPTKDIPIIWDFNIQSRDKALSQGWVEDGFCIATLGGDILQWGNPSCMQVNYVTDFSIQALAIEGAFQAIKEQNYFKTYGINFSTGYWHTDTLVPGPEGFPNLSQSIRGKPAENIVKAWYKR